MLFTFDNYRRLVASLVGRRLTVVTVAGFFESRPTDRFFVLRHDVEWDPYKALDLARLESSLGIASTYYFHGPHRARVFNVTVMREVEAMGHEVGYHYETLDRAGGDMRLARELFDADVSAFREAGLSLRTAAYHGNPRITKVGYELNGDLVTREPGILPANRLLGEPDVDVDVAALEYVSDVGVRFAAVEGDVIAFLSSTEHTRLHVLTHPDYWSHSVGRAFAIRWTASTMRAFRPVARVLWVVKDRVSR